jgi:hypothetical protein
LAFTLAVMLRAATAQPPDQRIPLPDGLLAMAVASSPAALDLAAQRLLNPWGVEPQSLAEAAKRLVPGAELAEREVVVGLAQPEGQREVAPFLLLPVEDAAKGLESLGADGGIVAFGHYEVLLEQIDGWLAATLIARPPLDWSSGAKAQPREAVLTLTLSDRGLDWLDAQLRDKPVRQRTPPRWPTTVADALRQAPRFAPLASVLADRARSVSVRLNDRTADTPTDPLRMAVDVELDPKRTLGENDSGGNPALPSVDLGTGTLAELAVEDSSSSAMTEFAVALAMAALECRPDDIEAVRYARPEYARYVEAVQRIASEVRGVRQSLLAPVAGDPIAANEFAVVCFDDDFELLKSLDEVAERWNEVVRASDARCPLLMEREPLAGPLLNEVGARYVVDTLVAIGGPAERGAGPQTEGLAELLGRFYGGDGVFERHVVQVDQAGLWVVSSLPASRAADLVRALRNSDTRHAPITAGASPIAKGRLSIEQTLAWLQTLDDLGHASTVGRRVPPPMAESPLARLECRSDGVAGEIALTLPWATYEAFAKRLTAEKVPASTSAP